MEMQRSAVAPAREPEPAMTTAYGLEVVAPEHRGLSALRILWVRRRTIARAILIGLVLSVILALILPKRYTSIVRLMPPDPQSSSLASLAAIAARTGNFFGPEMLGGALGMKTSGALFTGVLRSRTVQDRVIDRYGLMKVYGVKNHEAARQILVERSDVAEDRRTGIIFISVTDSSPGRAAQIAQAHVEELNRLVAELTTSSAHRERVFLEERLHEVKQDLDKAAADLGEFSSKNSTLDMKEQARSTLEAAATLQGSLIAAQSELRGLEQIYTPNNVRVRAVRARIAELDRNLQKLGGQTGKPELASDALNVPSIRTLPLLGTRYAELYRRSKMQETIFETLSAEYEMAKVQEAKEIPSVRVLDPADIPEKRSAPNRRLIVTIGTFLFFAFGIVFVLVSASWEDMDPADPRKTLLVEIGHTIEVSPWYRRVQAGGARVAAVGRGLASRFRRKPEP